MHAIAQGMDRCDIFRDDLDRGRFIRRAGEVFEHAHVEVLAWSLMDNHAHFALRPTGRDVSWCMQRILGSHALAFNRRHGRVGRLFRDRFWSRPVEDDDDLFGLLAYVILNPLDAGVVATLDDLCRYRWTSLAELLTPSARGPSLVQAESVLPMFGADDVQALERLVQMLATRSSATPAGAKRCRKRPEELIALSARERTDLRIPSNIALDLRRERLQETLAAREGATALRLRLRACGWDLRRVVARAATMCAVSAQAIRQGSRRRPVSRARGWAAHFGGLYLGCSDAEIARGVGTSRQSVSARRGEAQRLGAENLPSWEEFFEVDAVAAPPTGSGT